MAQLTSKVFQLLDNRSFRDGMEVFTGAAVTTAEPGLLARFTSGSEVGLATATQCHGVLMGARTMQYRPTTQVFGAGEQVILVSGFGRALISADFFVSSTLPTAGSNVYAAANGLWDGTNPAPAGIVKIGRCIRTRNVYQPVGASGTAISVAEVEFEFAP